MLQICHPITQHHIQKALFLHISEVVEVLHNDSQYLYPIKTKTNLRIPNLIYKVVIRSITAKQIKTYLYDSLKTVSTAYSYVVSSVICMSSTFETTPNNTCQNNTVSQSQVTVPKKHEGKY